MNPTEQITAAIKEMREGNTFCIFSTPNGGTVLSYDHSGETKYMHIDALLSAMELLLNSLEEHCACHAWSSMKKGYCNTCKQMEHAAYLLTKETK